MEFELDVGDLKRCSHLPNIVDLLNVQHVLKSADLKFIKFL